MKTVAVIEGFFGGPLHTRQFRKALAENGFSVTNPRDAEIIIAHSAGIYAVRSDTKAKLLLLIGPTYWPGKSLVKRVSAHAKTSRKYHSDTFGILFYIRKELLGLYYFFRRHRYMWLGIRNNNRLHHIEQLAKPPSRKVIVIRNDDDPFSAPQLRREINQRGIKYVTMPGVHDHFVMNPKPYIDLLLKEI
jgi:hypothetical protein